LTSGYDNLVGHFVNLLPIKGKIDEEQTFLEYLNSRRIDILHIYDNQQLTLGSLLKKLGVKRDLSCPPIISVLLNSTIGLNDDLNLNKLKSEAYDFHSGYEKFDLALSISGTELNPVFEWSYNTQLFKQTTIERITHEFEKLFFQIVEDPFCKIGKIDNTSFPVKVLINNDFPFPQDQTFLDLFSEQVKSQPSSIALMFEDNPLTYRELDLISNKLANYLIIKNKGSNNLIPMIISPSLEMIVALLG